MGDNYILLLLALRSAVRRMSNQRRYERDGMMRVSTSMDGKIRMRFQSASTSGHRVIPRASLRTATKKGRYPIGKRLVFDKIDPDSVGNADTVASGDHCGVWREYGI